MPSFGAEAPDYYYGVPDGERAARCKLTSDTCSIDDTHFFVRGCLDVPVHGAQEAFSWGVWVSLSDTSFRTFEDYYDRSQRSHIGPFFGWLSVELKPLYPSTLSLKTSVRLRDDGLRPLIELEPTDHPLAIEQRAGITVDRLAEIYAHHVHQ